MSSANTDDELVVMVLAGDKDAAFAELYSRHAPMVRAVALKVLGPADALDASQEAWLRAWARLTTYVPGSRFAGWITVICRNWCIDELRRRALRATTSGDGALPWRPDPAPGPEAACLAREAEDALAAALVALPPALAPAVTLVCGAGLGQREAGQVLGVTKATVKMRCLHGRRLLRARLAVSA